MEIVIKGCIDCPLCARNDFCPGYTCEAATKEIILEDSKKFIPITPDWCPAKRKPIVIGYIKSCQVKKAKKTCTLTPNDKTCKDCEHYRY